MGSVIGVIAQLLATTLLSAQPLARAFVGAGARTLVLTVAAVRM